MICLQYLTIYETTYHNKEKTHILGICQKKNSKNVIVIYWVNNKLKQLNSINSHYIKNGLLCLATACILAAIMYFLTVINHHEALCLSFIDNSNNYIIVLEIAYYCY